MFAEAKSDVLHAAQLSPRDPMVVLWPNTLASSDIGLGHFDDAINKANRAIEAGNRTFLAYTELAVAYAMTNRTDDAKAAVAEALKLNPKLTVKFMSERNSKTPAVAGGLRKAGLPEE
jgi:predicted Zn-dependent protease